MEESIQEYTDIGIVHFMAYPETIKGEGKIFETIKKIADDSFFSAIEISWIKDQIEKEKVKQLLQKSNLRIGYGAQPAILLGNLNPNSQSEEERQKAIHALKREIDNAYDMGAERIAIMSGKDPGDAEREKELDLLADTIKQLCMYSKEKGNLGITLEIFDRDIDKRCLIGFNDATIRVTEAVKKEHDNFGLMVDLSHIPLLRQTPQQAILPIKGHIVHAHIGNCVLKEGHPAYGDKHPRFGIESGKNNVKELADFLKVLLDIGFLNKSKKPIISFEVKPMEGETSEFVIANAKQILKEAWALV